MAQKDLRTAKCFVALDQYAFDPLILKVRKLPLQIGCLPFHLHRHPGGVQYAVVGARAGERFTVGPAFHNHIVIMVVFDGRDCTPLCFECCNHAVDYGRLPGILVSCNLQNLHMSKRSVPVVISVIITLTESPFSKPRVPPGSTMTPLLLAIEVTALDLLNPDGRAMIRPSRYSSSARMKRVNGFALLKSSSRMPSTTGA